MCGVGARGGELLRSGEETRPLPGSALTDAQLFTVLLQKLMSNYAVVFNRIWVPR